MDMAGKMINIVTVPRPRQEDVSQRTMEDGGSMETEMINQDQGLVHRVRMLGLDTAGVITWSGQESSNTMTLQTIRGDSWTIIIRNVSSISV